MHHLSKKWTLKSLTIGPQLYETDTQFWREAFNGLPMLPCVSNVTIVYNYPSVRAINTDCWEYFDRILIRQDLFPALKVVQIQPSVGSQRFSFRRWWMLFSSLRGVRSRGLLARELLVPVERGHRTDSYGCRPVVIPEGMANVDED